jgi:putative intracellular protease/amidase
MSKVLIVCAKRYNGHELFTLLGILQKRGHQFEVVSQDKLIRDELTLKPNTIERTVWETNPPEEVQRNDGIIVVSGNMSDTEAYWKDEHVISLLKAFKDSKRLVAAICCSVPTLAPVAKDAHVSYYPLLRSRDRLKLFGAILETVSVSVDQEHRMVTAENQMMSHTWAHEICNMLEGQPPTLTFTDSGWTPKGSERMMAPEVRAAIDEARGYGIQIKDPKKFAEAQQRKGLAGKEDI